MPIRMTDYKPKCFTLVTQQHMGISIILASRREEKEKAKRMLAAYGVGMVVIFGILIACPYLVKGIAAFIT